MKIAGWLALSVLVNVGLFGWMRNLVQVEEIPAHSTEAQDQVRLIHFEKLPAPKPEKAPKSRAKPKLAALSVPAPLPAMAQPSLAQPVSRPSLAQFSPTLTRPTLGPVSIKGRMVTGAAPSMAKAGRQGVGQAMQEVMRALPEPTLKVPPRYPPAALREGIEGWVKLSFVIDRRGRPGQVKVMASEPQEVFDVAAIRAVRKWSYPKQGQELSATVTLEFKMEDVP